MEKILLKNSWIWIVIQIGTKIECLFLLLTHPTRQKMSYEVIDNFLIYKQIRKIALSHIEKFH